jgi:hypothetical protein
MSIATLAALAALTGGALAAARLRQRRNERLATFQFPDHIVGKVQAAYPHLGPMECEQVMAGLRQFFAVAMAAQGRRVSMPSRVVDEAWHAFILSTREYQDFCQQVLGRFLHHVPAEAMATPTHAAEGVRRTWRLACRAEGIKPKSPHRLPLLFALDARLHIPGGFTYVLDCQRSPRRGGDSATDGGAVFCASHIASGDSDGGEAGGDDGCGGGCGGD